MAQAFFIGLEEVAGYYSGLAKGLKELGHKVDQIDLFGNRFNYGTELHSPFIKAIQSLCQWANRQHRLVFLFVFGFTRPLLFLTTFFSYDVFIFSFGKTFFYGKELFLYKLFKKTTIVIYNGSDSRPAFMDVSVHTMNVDQIYYENIKRFERCQRIEKGADYIVCLPSTSQFFKTKLLDFYQLGVPLNLDKFSDFPQVSNKRPKLLHCPSNRAVKGSDHIKSIVEKLRQKFDFDYKELTGVSNREILEEISKSDLIIDQMYSDTPLAGLAFEACALDKTVIVCGYFAKDSKKLYQSPTHYILPEQLEDTLHLLLENSLDNQGSIKKAIFSSYGHKHVASRLLSVLEGENQYSYDAQKIQYEKGCGAPLKLIIEKSKELVKKYGDKSLRLDHRPKLKEKFLTLLENRNDFS